MSLVYLGHGGGVLEAELLEDALEVGEEAVGEVRLLRHVLDLDLHLRARQNPTLDPLRQASTTAANQTSLNPRGTRRRSTYRGFGIGLVLLARVGGICGGVGRGLVLLLILLPAASALVLPRFLPVGGGGGPVGDVGARVGGHGGRRSEKERSGD